MLATSGHPEQETPVSEVRPGVPSLPDSLLSRERLSWLLRRGESKSVTLIQAPAGFGKTTAVADWARRRNRDSRVAWFAVTTAEEEPRQFWASFVASIRAAHPAAMASLESHIAAGQDFGGRASARALSDAFYGITEPLTVVFDDFERVSHPDILETLSFLVGAIPPTVNFVICSRTTPDLPLSRWRASGRLFELEIDDLRFTAEEAGAYLDPLLAGKLQPDQETIIIERTQGWMAGLYLAALGVQRSQDTAAFVNGFNGSETTVANYVVDEVLRQIPEPMAEFLLQTSILSALSPPLCDAVTGKADSVEMLNTLAATGIFVSTDDTRESWTYHPLFREALQHQLASTHPNADITALHLRAAGAYEELGRFTEALAHAAAAEDNGRVTQIIEDHSKAMLRTSPHALNAALARVPEQLLQQSLECRVVQLSAAAATGNLNSLEVVAGRETLDGDQGLGETALALLTYLRGDYLDLDAVTPDDRIMGRGIWLAAKGVVATHQERYEEAAALLERALEDEYDEPYSPIALISALAWNRVRAGVLSRGSTYAARAIAMADAAGLRWFHGVRWAELARAQRSFDLGHIEEAHHQVEGIADSLIYDGRFKAETHLLTAQICSSRGDHIGATEHLTAAAPAVSNPAKGIVSERIAVANARQCLIGGDIELAAAWIPDGQSLPGQPGSLEYRLTLARLLIESKRYEEARESLASVTTGDCPIRHRVEAEKLQAIAASRLGDPSASLLLEAALAAGREAGLIQTFIDDSLALAAISRPSHSEVASAADPAKQRSPETGPRAETVPMVEPLTDRELSVLRLLPTRLTNHEIADELFISVNTVKTHVKAIYRKLEVSNRNAAVDSAVSMRLL